MTEKLILVLSEHRQFGWKLNLYAAGLHSEGSVSILGVPSLEEEIQKNASDVVVALIREAEAVSDYAILKAFSKDKNKSEFSQSTIDNLIRPRIELSNQRLLALSQQIDIPIYYRENSKYKMLYDESLVKQLPVASHCLFNFVKDETGLRYFISLTNGFEEIELQQTPAVVLSQEPCIVLLNNQIHTIKDIESKKLVPFFSKTHIDVPASSEKVYIQNFILKTIPKYEVRIEGIEMQEKFPQKQGVLVLEEDFHQRLTFFLYFQYDYHRISPFQRRKKIVGLEEINGIENICWFERDLDWEKGLVDHLTDLGLHPESDNHRFYLKQDTHVSQKYGLIGWMNMNIDQLHDFLIEQKTIRTYYQQKVEIKSKLDEKIDWFDVEIQVVFDHFSIPFNRFRKHILTGNPEFILPDGSIFILPEEWFHRYQEFFLHGTDTENGIRLKKFHYEILNNTMADPSSKYKENGLNKLNQISKNIPIPSKYLDQILRPYQKEGFFWLEHLRANHFGGCLADDMGLGKTLQSIVLLESIYAEAKKEKIIEVRTDNQLTLFDEWKSTIPASLVVAPTSLLHNWQNELKKFAPDLKIYIYAGAKRLKTKDIERIFRNYQVIITSYSILRMDIDYLKEYPFYYIILDESQYIKNPDSMVYRAVKDLYSSHKLVLTGTPIENSLSDLWAQFNFINPGLLGTFSLFKDNYIQKITKEKNKQAEISLQKLIQPFFFRRTKEEVTPELPPLSQEIVYCDMTEAQEEIYQSEKNSIRNMLLENKERLVANNFVALQSLMRLRLLSNHPRLINSEYEGDSGKFDQIILYFEGIKAGKHKVLIFSSFVKHLKLLSKKFDENGWKYAMLTGHTANREEEINKFTQNEDVNCFFISLKAGGTGLNLTAADYVFIIDPWWNPAAEMQAVSRAHRIGQQKNVLVYRFISSNTIEEKIVWLQEAKSHLSESFITSNNPLAQLDTKEIKELFE